MLNPERLTVDEFFTWQALVEGRYELVDGHIVPHPDYFDAQRFAAPDNDHGAVISNIVALVSAHLLPPCRVYPQTYAHASVPLYDGASLDVTLVFA